MTTNVQLAGTVELGSKEFYDMLDQFEKMPGVKGYAREKDKDWWRRGAVYENGEVNRNLTYFQSGYTYGKLAVATEYEDMLAQERQKVASLEAQLAEARGKFETMHEVAGIHIRLLQEARERLEANGIYEDWGDEGKEQGDA